MRDWQGQSHVKWYCKHEAKIRAYIRDQEAEEKRLEQLRLQGL